jgi:hypothetical protein
MPKVQTKGQIHIRHEMPKRFTFALKPSPPELQLIVFNYFSQYGRSPCSGLVPAACRAALSDKRGFL